MHHTSPPPESHTLRVLFIFVCVGLLCLVASVPLIISYQHQSVVGILFTLLALTAIPLWRFQGKIRAAMRFRAQRSALRAALAQRIAQAGLTDAHPGDRRRVELEQIFWRDAQRDAVESLRLRFGQDPTPPDITGILLQRLLIFIKENTVPLIHKNATKEQKDKAKGTMTLIMILSIAICFITFMVSSSSDHSSDTQRHIPYTTLLFSAALLTITLSAIHLFISTWDNIQLEIEKTEDYNEFIHTRRHVAELVELSGGITIVEGTSAGGELQIVDTARPGDLQQVARDSNNSA
jgi:energy-coupling factor transporter transmembrane protein EcfT